MAGLIVSEALREEIHRSGRFTVVNRQDLKRAMDEMKTGESGLLEEGKALRLGKWLAANQSVSGEFHPGNPVDPPGAGGTDLETAGIMAAASIRLREGKEEELWTALPQLGSAAIPGNRGASIRCESSSIQRPANGCERCIEACFDVFCQWGLHLRRSSK